MAAADRLAATLKAIIAAILPQLALYARWEYKVVAVHVGTPPVTPTTIDCIATNLKTTSIVPKTLNGIVLWPGPSGGLAVPQVGSLVRVAFTNADSSKPEVVSLDPNSIPLVIKLGGPVPTPACLATVNATNMANIVTFLTSHTHPVPGVTVGSGATTSSPAALTPPVISSTAAQIVKIQ